MNLSEVAIKRPVFTTMMTAALLILGLVGFSRLGTDLFPDVSFPVVVVNIAYPGAGPSEVETLVSKEIEESVVSLNGIDRVRSQSREGLSTTIVMFKLGVDVAEAATQVRERVSQVRYKLPTDVKEPTINRFDVSAAPILTYTLRGDRPLSALRKFAEDEIQPALEQVEGVASINVKGGAKREVHVNLDPARLRGVGLDSSQILARLQAANLTVPAGHYDEGTREISVRTLGEFTSVEAIRDLVVATRQNGPDGFSVVRLRDVARVEDGYEELRTRVRVNGDESVSFEVLKQSGQNTVAIADAVQAKLAAMQKDFPSDIKPALIIDQSRYIKDNIHEVEIAIVFGGAMAILVILVFMLDLRSTLISAVALPTSVVGTFFFMYLFGYTLNMMTLLGLSLAIGLLIDDAVVVRENIFKHLERGKDPKQAALDGTKEIALSVLATTLTIVAVFLPVAFVSGMVGQFFRQFGITISVAVVLSLLVAFTVDPMLSSRFSKALHRGAGHHDARDRFAWLKRPFEVMFAAMDDGYRGMLGWALRHKLLTALFALGGLFLTGWVSGLMGNEFMNSEDHSQYLLEAELPAGTSLDETDRLSSVGEQKLLAADHTRVVYAILGPDGEVNRVSWRVLVDDKLDRPGVTLDRLKDVARDIAKAALPGAKISINDPPMIEGAASEAPIMIDVRGSTYEDIAPVADQVGAILRGTPGIEDVQVKYSPGRPELQVSIDRQRAAAHGLAVAQVAMALRTAMEGTEATKLRQGKDEIPVMVRFDKKDRDSQEELMHLPLATPMGVVELGDVATVRRGEGPQVIEREDRSRQIQIWAAPRGRPLGDIVQEVKPQLDAMKLPAGTRFAYDGQIRMMNETNANMGLALLLGVLFIYIVLASQFESFIHPLTIMLTLPLAMVGAVLALFLTGNTMAMGALIGIILLMGLVTKNAILLIDRAIVRVRDEGEPPLQAILEAGPERLRPILMTSAAMVLGMLPTAIGKGEGSEFRAPMAIAVIGGVISSTLLSLVVVPVFYQAIENAKARLARLRKKGRPSSGQAPAAVGELRSR